MIPKQVHYIQVAEAAEGPIPRQPPQYTVDPLQPAHGLLNGKVLISLANQQHSETLLSQQGKRQLVVFLVFSP